MTHLRNHCESFKRKHYLKNHNILEPQVFDKHVKYVKFANNKTKQKKIITNLDKLIENCIYYVLIRMYAK